MNVSQALLENYAWKADVLDLHLAICSALVMRKCTALSLLLTGPCVCLYAYPEA